MKSKVLNNIVEIILMVILAMLGWVFLMRLLFWPNDPPSLLCNLVPGFFIGASIMCEVPSIMCEVLYLRKDRESQKYK